MTNFFIFKKNNNNYIDSREVAECIGQSHRRLLRDIRGYAASIDKIGAPNFASADFFVEDDYQSKFNKMAPCFLLSKRGCDFLASKLNGKKCLIFTAAYISSFHELEEAERAEAEARAATPQLRVFNSAVKNVLNGFAYTHSSPENVIEFLRGAYQPFGITVIDRDASDDHHLSATDIAALLKIYSEAGRPHAHAVAAIIDKLNIAPSHIGIIPFGMVGVSIRYDRTVSDAVKEWLDKNDYPNKVPYLDFNYHIYYDRQMSLNDYEYYDGDYQCGEDYLYFPG